jgi:hypothetical protein
MRTLTGLVAVVLLVIACSGSSGTSQASPTASSAATPLPTQSAATPTPALATPAGPSADNSSFKFRKIAGGLESPVYITGAGDGSGRLFIIEQVGRIRIVKDGVLLATPFLDIRSLVASVASAGC